jgi:hypothetical protein
MRKIRQSRLQSPRTTLGSSPSITSEQWSKDGKYEVILTGKLP